MAHTMMNCGEVHLLAGRRDEAQRLLQQSISVLSEELPEAHWRLAWLKAMLELANGGSADAILARLDQQLAATLGNDSLVAAQLARQAPILRDALNRR